MSAEEPFCRIIPATEIADLELLRPVLFSAIRHPLTLEVFTDEVDEVLGEVAAFRAVSNERYFAVATTAGGEILGMMGLKHPDITIAALSIRNNPIELVRAAVLESKRERGVGKTLVKHLETYATSQGHDELLLNSGPRYRPRGWPFWRKMYGEPVGKLMDYYGPGYHAPVWRTDLPRARQ